MFLLLVCIYGNAKFISIVSTRVRVRICRDITAFHKGGGQKPDVDRSLGGLGVDISFSG